jgi:hypothetical protein
MMDLVVFAVVFALAGAFFLWLRRLGRRMAAGQKAVADTSADSGPDKGEEIVANVEFAIDALTGAAKRRTRRHDDAGGDNGGDGGGGGGE